MSIRAAVAVTLLAVAATAQGAVLDVLDGETLYDGGFLVTLGQEIARKEVLRSGSQRVTDPFASHETHAETTLALQYGLRNDLQLGIATSWVDRERDTVAGELGADGFGDLDLMAKYRFLRFDGVGFATNFSVLSGVSLPTGNDDEPAAGLSLPSGGGGDPELEPALQPGSGGIDPWLGVGVTHEPGRWRFNAATMYQWHTDSDRDGDWLGDEFVFELAVGNRFWLEPYPGPFMRLDLAARFYHEDEDHQDGLLPDTGGQRYTLGVNYAFRPRPSLDFQVYFELPVHQQVHGTQLGDDWQVDVTFGHRF